MQFDKSFPIIMRGLMTTEDWAAMSWSPKDWCQALTCDTVRVRSGQIDPKLDHPQWERYTCTKDLKGRHKKKNRIFHDIVQKGGQVAVSKPNFLNIRNYDFYIWRVGKRHIY